MQAFGAPAHRDPGLRDHPDLHHGQVGAARARTGPSSGSAATPARSSPGLRFLVPLMDRVGRKINMMETVLDIEEQEVITRDNAMVVADAVAFYQVVDAVQGRLRGAQPRAGAARTSARPTSAPCSARWISTRRCPIAMRSTHGCSSVIDHASTPWGVKVTRVEIRDLAPPPDISEAMARQMKAERLKRAEILTAEGLKQSAILKAEGEREAQIREAEGRRQAAFLDAEARERSAEAEAQGDDDGVARRSPRATCRRSTTSWRRSTPRRCATSPPARTPRRS